MTPLEKVAEEIADAYITQFLHREELLARGAFDPATALARAALLSLKEVDEGTVEAMESPMVAWLDGVIPTQPYAARSILQAALDHILTGGAE